MCSDSDMELKKARGYALRLFKLRPRSEGELRDKLKLKGYTPEVSGKVISDLTDYGMIDDAAFAKAWLQSRLKRYGFRRVSRELSEKGIDKELVQSLWQEARGDYDELATVREIVQKRMRTQERQGVPFLKRKKHIFDHLARRGFGLEAINKVLREI